MYIYIYVYIHSYTCVYKYVCALSYLGIYVYIYKGNFRHQVISFRRAAGCHHVLSAETLKFSDMATCCTMKYAKLETPL